MGPVSELRETVELPAKRSGGLKPPSAIF